MGTHTENLTEEFIRRFAIQKLWIMGCSDAINLFKVFLKKVTVISTELGWTEIAKSIKASMPN